MNRVDDKEVCIMAGSVALRDFRAGDLIQYQRLRSDPKMHRFYSEEDSSDARAGQLLEMFIEQSTSRPRTKFQLAVESASGELMGTCGIRIESPGEASIGCEIGRQWHGSGVAREAASALLEFGFSTLDVTRIYAETISENVAAIRLCRSIGMTAMAERIADRTFKGRTWNTTVVSLSREEWPRKTSRA
ncbi:GNAT family N-acetyltransferase [Paraburkholderia bryophila]|uniref:RimJ/RimL family protein N-acetyltransferase n=1 Tax=Paraburkholderia bryophila TaxID=420952 RepID=A0A7Y9WU48_9BURK|nr:GNAT family N-acetyltransferase [Paraburkholderia bryophila]NYH26837.1 RimJ/RimL family protein N-acetyltransferase [Paraburkholderia bryophila]